MSTIVKREFYLKKLIDHKDNDFVKVLTGLRRSGKTYLLKMFQNYLFTSGITTEQVIYLNFESFQAENYLLAKSLYEFVSKQVQLNKKIYLIFDEIQLVNDWQKAINSFRVDFNCDIYITGSNASLLSGELATLLSGRYVELRVYPLSFSEFLEFNNIKRWDEKNVNFAFQKYYEFGGMPAIATNEKTELKYDFLASTFDSIFLKDVSARADGARNTDTLVKIAHFLIDSIGSPISVNKLEQRLKSLKLASSRVTINNYFRLMEEAFIFYKTERINLKGSGRLLTNNKYYIADNGLWNGQNRNIQTDRGHRFENIVYMELIRRGYEVAVGNVDNYEIDFIAQKREILKYFQVTEEIPQNNNREVNNLLKIKDNYEKFLIVGSDQDYGDFSGIKVLNIQKFLLNLEI
jgi:predicted AAA+ superfamily ATPase